MKEEERVEKVGEMAKETFQRAFAENFVSRGDLGAAACVWTDDGEVISLAGGLVSREEGAAEWTRDTLVPVWSSTKGPAVAVVLRALDRAGLNLATPVRHVWPAFPVEADFAEALSHRAGLAALDEVVSVFDHDASRAALERQMPNWFPGAGHGYAPRVFGIVLEEMARRLAGAPLGEIWRREIAQPLDLDMWIGLPESEFPRVATVQPGRMMPRPQEAAFIRAWSDPASLTRRSFASPRGLNAVTEMNQPVAWQLGQPAFTGLASARGLAKFYHAFVTGGGGVFSDQVRAWAETTLVEGDDLVLHLPTAFSAGFQKDPLDATGRKLRRHYGSNSRAFGHPGAGGSLAFGDPARRLGFAYVMNNVAPGVMPNERALSLVAALDA